MYYDSEAYYISSRTDTLAKIAAIDACIDALLASVLLSVGKSATQEYMLNDGQTTIRTMYRNPNEVIDAVSRLRLLKRQYMNDINPTSVRMVDSKNLYPKRFGTW